MKFYGIVGYGKSGEAQNGVHVNRVTEYPYFGDVVKDTRRVVTGADVNAAISPGNSIEIVADPYANEHFHAIKYVEWAGALWTVTEVEQKRPRLILRLGGVYDGPRPASTSGGSSKAETASPPRRDSGR